MSVANPVVAVAGLSNREFLEKYARSGCVGLSGGPSWIDKVITRAERRVGGQRHSVLWSHAFLFQGQRLDEHHWVIESDLAINRKHIRLGVQENRLSKYHDEAHCSTLAVLDFGLSDEHTAAVLRVGLDLAPGLDEKHTTPEDISRTAVPHPAYLRQRPPTRAQVAL